MTPDELLDLVKTEVASDDPQVRGQGLQRLLTVARDHESFRGAALPIFKTALESEVAPWSALNAARGIELIAGREEGRRAWRRLLDHREAEVVAATAAVVDPTLAPALMDVLERRAERNVRIPVLRALGRMKYGLAYDALVRALADPDLRPHAIEALGELGDVRAVEHLTPLLLDTTEAWPEDNHGPMLRVRDLAKTAIERIGPVGTPAPLRVMKAAAAPGSGPRKLEPMTPTSNVFSYVPLVAAAIEVLWVGFVMFIALVVLGPPTKSDLGTQVLDVIAMSPALLGLIGGAVALRRGGPRTTVEWVCFIIGLLLCALFTLSFGFEFFHPHVDT